MPDAADDLNRPFILTRTFNAPRDLVWKAWTDEAHLAKWFGPKGTKIVRAKMDLRPGGSYHYGMEMPNGQVMWGRWIIREVVAPEKLVVIVSFSDEQGGVTRHPMAADWPLQTLSKTTFSAQGDKTLMRFEWSAYEATVVEKKAFDAGRASMEQGWGGTLQQLDEYLASVQSR